MASMTINLASYSDNGNSHTYVDTVAHTANRARLVISKRKAAEGGSQNNSYQLSVVGVTEDAAGAVLASKVAWDLTVRYPVDGIAADRAWSKATFLDIVNSDEFAAAVDSLLHIGE